MVCWGYNERQSDKNVSMFAYLYCDESPSYGVQRPERGLSDQWRRLLDFLASNPEPRGKFWRFIPAINALINSDVSSRGWHAARHSPRSPQVAFSTDSGTCYGQLSMRSAGSDLECHECTRGLLPRYSCIGLAYFWETCLVAVSLREEQHWSSAKADIASWPGRDGSETRTLDTVARSHSPESRARALCPVCVLRVVEVLDHGEQCRWLSLTIPDERLGCPAYIDRVTRLKPPQKQKRKRKAKLRL